MRQINNEQGFSLVGALVGLAVFSIGMSAVADFMVLSAKQQRDIRSNSEINTIFDRVRSVLHAEWACTASMGGMNPVAALTIKDPVSATTTIANEGMAKGQFWQLTKVRLEQIELVPSQPGLARGVLVMEATKNVKLSIGSPRVRRELADVYFQVDQAGALSRCYGATETAQLDGEATCEMLGGTWYADRPHGAQCRLNNSSNAKNEEAQSEESERAGGNGNGNDKGKA